MQNKEPQGPQARCRQVLVYGWQRSTHGGPGHLDKTLTLKASGSIMWWDKDAM